MESGDGKGWWEMVMKAMAFNIIIHRSAHHPGESLNKVIPAEAGIR